MELDIMKKQNLNKVKELIFKSVDEVNKENIPKKKSTKENLKDNEVSTKPVEFFPTSVAKKVDFGRKSAWVLKDKVEDWTNRDFYLYISNKYFTKYSEKWGYAAIAISNYINKIKEVLLNMIGFLDNITFRDYIDFFFEKWSTSLRENNKNQTIYPKYFIKEEVVNDFVKYYDMVKREVNLPIESNNMFNEKDFEASYLVDKNSWVVEYGVILTSNWLILKKEIDEKQAVEIVKDIVQKVCKSDKIKDKIRDNTFKYSPYPEWFKMKDSKEFLIFSENEIKFEENKKYESWKR